MTRRRGARRRGGRRVVPVAAASLLGLSAAAAPHPAGPVLHDPVRLAQGMKVPQPASEGADAAPPAALPPGATLGVVPADAGSASLTFSSAPVSFSAAPVTAAQGSAAVPGTAPVVATPSARARSDNDSVAGADTDGGQPVALPPGARLSSAPIAFSGAEMRFSAAEMRFAAAQIAWANAPVAVPSAAALPGGMEMREEGRGLRITLDADVLFDFDRAELRRDAGPRLQRLMEEVSARVPRPSFRVEGHTDWVGTDAYNLRLSTRRAESVRNWLVRAAGVPRPAVSTVGYGESRPVAPNSTPEGRDDPDGRQRNRRVELLVTPR